MDGHELQLEDDTFDLTAWQLAWRYYTDLPRALAEMVRVTEAAAAY